LKTYASPTLAALSGGAVAIVQLVHLAFASPIALNLSNWDLTWSGTVYKGAYGLGAISGVTDKPGEVQGLTLELFGDAAAVALALDDADVVQGTVCTIRTAIMDIATYTILDAPIEWLGKLDTMTVAEDGKTAVISVSVESGAVDLLRGNPSFYSDADQRAISATDGSMMYVVDQISKPIVWPARAFYYQ
jgi:hypothetical protein